MVGDPAARAALDALVRGRLLAAREVEGGTAYEVAHEALLHGWATLREWLDAQAESRVVRQRLEGAAAEWERLGRTGEVLWSARQLAEAALIRREELQPREVEFLRDQVRRQQEIIAQQAVTMRQLSAPPEEAPGDAETVEEAPDRAEPRSDAAGPQMGAQGPWSGGLRSLRRRILGW